MLKYILKRIGAAVVTLFILSIVVFLISHMASGDPASIILGDTATEEQINDLRESMGLNQPLIVQYFNWLINAVQGDLGVSYYNGDSVVSNIADRLKPSLMLAISAQIVAIILALPMGVFAARYKGEKMDYVLSSLAILGMSMPAFLVSLLLMLIFGVKLGWLPVTGYKTFADGFGTWLRYNIIPVLALGTSHAGLTARMTRSSMAEVLNTDYIKTAKAKGITNIVILFKHALRNAFIPVLTIIGGSFGNLLAGTAIVETMFNIPGVGQLIITCISRRDYPVIVGIVITISVIWIIINLVVDLLYGVIDPRVRISGKTE